jgi:hypothetical protein
MNAAVAVFGAEYFNAMKKTVFWDCLGDGKH